MAKSAAFTAWRPSLPEMPTPTCASWIIGTSLAPSPMDKVTGRGVTPSRTSRTISAFCRGETRHAMTTAHCSATRRKRAPKLCVVTTSRNWPVTSNAAPTSLGTHAVRVLETSSSSAFSTKSVEAPPGSSLEQSNTMMSIPSTRTFVLKPMMRAVSSLSPVSTQSFMPAMRTRSIVSATPTCSLSSMAVAPTMSKPRSMRSATACNNSSRFSMLLCAAS
mmetsp:Transcript_51381/g.143651  ORF Transcript_51381/g.143651 Transcript_51381/m.143651 type:complete len:219 (-) Transcript_51381:73-729(-)